MGSGSRDSHQLSQLGPVLKSFISLLDALITRTWGSFTGATKKSTVGYGRRVCALIRDEETGDGRWFLKILTIIIFEASETDLVYESNSEGNTRNYTTEQ